MRIVHLTASTFLGGPERQMLGLAEALRPDDDSLFLSFAEGGRCRDFLAAARQQGFEASALHNDTPHFRAAIAEVADHLERFQADVLLCHGYKSDLLGRRAARRQKLPVAAVSRGWTGESLKVRLYEAVDCFCLRWMDRVVSVSTAQASKVLRTGVKPGRVHVIPNAIDSARFAAPNPIYRDKLVCLFRTPPARIIGAAGRLSPEKGFDVLADAAAIVLRHDPSIGFVLFGEGSGRPALMKQLQASNIAVRFVLAGFRNDLDHFIPFFDLLALPSYTEGLPNVVLEAFAAGVPVVGTAVGGTPEVVDDGVTGYLVPPGDPQALADRLLMALASEARRRAMGLRGRQRMLQDFTFAAQAKQYTDLFEQLCPEANRGCQPPVDLPQQGADAPRSPALAMEGPCKR
jgi:glycosyltransferase involved in cell wall biosynthesis